MERKEAKSKGLGTYFTGRPCRRGHVSARYVSGGQCLECVSAPERTVVLLFPDAGQADGFWEDLVQAWRAARVPPGRRVYECRALEGGAAEVTAYVPPSRLWGLVGHRAKAGAVLPLTPVPWVS